MSRYAIGTINADGSTDITIKAIDDSLTSDDGHLIVSTLPAALEIAKGDVPGHSLVNKFGRTTNADDDDPTDIWDRANVTHNQPAWLAPTAARVHALVSTSASDDGAPAGVGARTVKIYGLADWDTVESSEIITLNGTTPVNTVGSYVIIHRIKVMISGGSGPNVGTITATAATDGTVTAQIEPGQGQTQMAIYGVPSTQVAYMTKFYASLLKANLGTGQVVANVNLFWAFDVENFPNVWQVKHSDGITTYGTSKQDHEYNPYNGFAGPGIFKLQITTGANNMDVSGGFDVILVDN